MSFGLYVEEQIQPRPSAGDWTYTLTWHMREHHQSGISAVRFIPHYALIGERQIEAVLDEPRMSCFAELLQQWEIEGAGH